MSDLSKMLSALVVSALIGTSPALAQETGTATESDAVEAPAAEAEPAAPASDLNLGAAVADPNAPGTPYEKESHGDWQIRCIRAENGNDPCQLYQLIKDGDGNSVAEISMFALPEGQQAAAGATIAAPLETLLTGQITLAIDGGQAKRYPFTWCTKIGCFARVGFTAEEIAAFKAGSKGTLTIVPLMAPDQRVDLNVSLSGFTAGYDAVAKMNAE